jgi:hypothetical protein
MSPITPSPIMIPQNTVGEENKDQDKIVEKKKIVLEKPEPKLPNGAINYVW